MKQIYIGIDIAKHHFYASFYEHHHNFDNNLTGFECFLQWTASHCGARTIHLVIESTSIYWQPLAYWAYNRDICISVINPLYIHAYAKSLGIRLKTDKHDAKLLARYGTHENPPVWQPKSATDETLHQLICEYLHQKKELIRQKTRQETAHPATKNHIKQHIHYWQGSMADLQKQIWAYIHTNPLLSHRAALIGTIPGIGKATIPLLLDVIGDGTRFDSAKHLVSYVGLAPRQYTSGISIHKQSAIGYSGQGQLRAALFMPAMVVSFGRYPAFDSFVKRLQSRGKTKKQIIIAIMRKLLTIAYAVIKYNTPYDESHHR